MFALWIECFKMGLRELWRHRLRSFLTMIGMIMGVSVVIICVSVVQGVKDSLIGDIRKAGKNMMFVFTEDTRKGIGTIGVQVNTNLSRDDAEAIELECDGVAMASGVQGTNVLVVSDTSTATVPVTGADHKYTAIRNWGIEQGRDLEPFDVIASRRVCLIGQTTMRELFGDRNAINRTVRIGRISLKIVGVLEPKGINPLGMDEDNALIVPLPIMLRDIMNRREPDAILCSAKSDDDVEFAVQQITQLLRQRHKLAEADKNDFRVSTLKEKEEQARTISNQMTLLMFFLALVSLMVGGVGIMNIMLVSVTERTREIGIRMAIGASTKAINRQFLIEAAVISTAGGTVGIVLGVSGAAYISSAIGVEPLMSPAIVGIAFLFSAGVGVIFGLLPARRAAGLNPIEALRHD
ncbi:MAG: ABC transporter permease [Phycisphaerales bacterium]|nr:ABC transporter permease [Phycisphaerales bacterium]MCB9864676.1 ABC transporter permease [Phycisphaerales bacterium]